MTLPLRANHGSIEGLCNGGHLDQALDVLFHMDTAPSTNTYLVLLKTCIKGKSLSQLKQVEMHIAKHIHHVSIYLGDYLVMALARCGAVEDALKLSSELSCRTVFSWTAIISAYAERGQGWQALKLYECMREDGVRPNHFTFVGLLKACGSIPDIDKIRILHNDARSMGLEADVYICTTLVSVYGKCGAINEAENVFTVLSKRDVVAWNAMLTAYVNKGLASKAIQLFRQMHEEEVRLDQLMFVIALQACGILAEKEGESSKSVPLEIGRALHADARHAGFCSGAFMLTSLMNMYSKCGSMDGAEIVFSTALPQCNNVTWNVMVSAYFEHNQERKSLQLYKYMQDEGTSTDQYTFASALQACGALAEKEEALTMDGQRVKVMSLELGKALHADAHRLNFLTDVFVGNTLIRIYGKCGAIMEAEDVFCKLFNRDIVSWNALLSSYVEHRQAEKALLLYKQMQDEMVGPEQLAFAMVLQACGQLAEKEEHTLVEGGPIKLKSLEIGLELQADALKGNFATDVVVGDSLVRMYTKCGTVVHAEDVFVALRSQHDVRFWTAMLSAYVELEHPEKALQLYTQMYKEGVTPDQHTFVVALHTCGILAEKEESTVLNGHHMKGLSLEIGRAIHSDARKMGYVLDTYVNNTLISMYSKCGAIAQAENLFIAMTHRDEVSWNAIFSAYSAYNEQAEKILQLYRQMQLENFSPDQLTFVLALQACSNLAERKVTFSERGIKAVFLEIGQAIHFDAQMKGFGSDVLINNTLVSMYGKCGNLQAAEALFSSMYERDRVSWTAMLSVYVEQKGEKVLELYREMQKQSVILDEVSLVCVLRACCDIGSLELCRQHHFTIASVGYDSKLSVAVTLVHSYGTCASMIDAQAAFDGLQRPDSASWNACMASYAGEGDSKATMYSFEQLQLAGAKPNEVSFISALTSSAHGGLVVQAMENFEHMQKDCGFYPDLKHYSILIDLFGRLGDFKRVENMLGHMPMQADLTMWLCLLGACRIHGNLDVGVDAFYRAVSLQPTHSAAYVMLSNLYVEVGLQNQACKGHPGWL